MPVDEAGSPARMRAAPNSSPYFLLVRLDGLGDAFACVPLLEGLSRAYPQARFGAVCSPANAAVFSERVHPVHVLERGHAPGRVQPRLDGVPYSHAIVATEEVAGYEIARASRAPRRSGFWHGFEKPFKSMWQFRQLTDRVYRPARWTSRPEHEVEALYRLALPFGAVAPPSADAARLRPWLSLQTKLAVPEHAIGFQISQKLTLDEWGPNALASLLTDVWRASGLGAAVLLAAPADQGLARSILEHVPSPMQERTQLLPAAGTAEWLGAIVRLHVLITPDTGAAHAAGMLGVPVIDIFEQARFEQLSRQWRPWAAPSRCLAKPALGSAEARAFAKRVGASARELLVQHVNA